MDLFWFILMPKPRWLPQSDVRVSSQRDDLLLCLSRLQYHFHYEKEWLVKEFELVRVRTAQVFLLVILMYGLNKLKASSDAPTVMGDTKDKTSEIFGDSPRLCRFGHLSTKISAFIRFSLSKSLHIQMLKCPSKWL